jgi:hypothetical protein
LIGSGVAAISLLVLAVTLKGTLGLDDLAKKDKDFGADMFIKVSPSVMYYLLLLCSAGAAVVSYLLHKNEKELAYSHDLEKELLVTGAANSTTNTENDVNTTID